MKSFLVSEESSLKNFTDNHCAQASFCFRSLLKAREIKVNGAKVSCDLPLKIGDRVEYFLSPAQEQKIAFSNLYEDENLLLVDKESGVNSEAVFFASGLLPVHRLDRNTSGLLLLAKTLPVQEELLSLFRERKVTKIYHALVIGKMPKPHDTLIAYLKKDRDSARVKIFSQPCGEKIVTEYEVMEQRGDASLLKITLHTGKTHQIRAHLAFLNHPVVGDEKYGDSQYNRLHHVLRQKLLAKSLSLSSEGMLSYLNGKTFSSPKEL